MALPTLQNNGWLPSGTPWAEHVTRSGGLSDMQLSYESGNQAAFVIQTNGLLETVVQDILGSNLFNPATLKINRVPPLRHPYKENLYANRICSVKGLKWKGKVNSFPAPYSSYDRWVITIAFGQPRWSVLDDATLANKFAGAEYRRFVQFDYQPVGEYLSRNQGSFKWAEGGGSGPVVDTDFKGSLGQFVQKKEIILTWKYVPKVGLFSSGGDGSPTNLDLAVGTVNNATFLTYPAGTLLLKPYKLIPKESAISLGIGIGFGNPPQLFDVELPMTHFDPTPGGATRGHNLAPWTDGKWYRVYDATTKTRNMYSISDFTQIFKLVL